MRKVSLLMVLACIACGKEATAPSVPPLSALWSVQTVNGTSLPFTVLNDGTTREDLLQRRYALSITNPDSGTFVQYAVYRFASGGVVDTVAGQNAGAFTIHGSTLVFHYNGIAGSDSAVWNGGDQLRLTDGHDVSVLAR